MNRMIATPSQIGFTARARKACPACRSQKKRCDLVRTILSRLDSLENRIDGISDLNNKSPFQTPVLEETRDGLFGGGDAFEITENNDSPSLANENLIGASLPVMINLHTSWWKATLKDTLEWPLLAFEGDAKRALEARIIHQDQTCAKEVDIVSELYDRDLITHLVALFVQEVHTKNPILELAQIEADTHHALSNRFGNNSESCFVVGVAGSNVIVLTQFFIQP
ncbi:hypothetical protein N7540_010936 [Penicillium herquei]|nr:hypothetical protein N7540_010936 [Penicillium herquei]